MRNDIKTSKFMLILCEDLNFLGYYISKFVVLKHMNKLVENVDFFLHTNI